MGNWDKIYAVQRMQNYIKAHVNEFIQLEDIVKGSGYSKRHAMRIFRELLGKTPLEYVRAIRLTESEKVLLKKSENILDTTLGFGYDTHEGFTTAGSRLRSLRSLRRIFLCLSQVWTALASPNASTKVRPAPLRPGNIGNP